MRRAVIVGGGLAGLTLGILLRRRGVPTEVWELGDYPRHRVCGEFISGAGAQLLLELLPLLSRRMRPIETVQFCSDGRQTDILRLPSAGLGIARYALDFLLATEFKNCGGDLRTRERWTGSFEQDGVIRTTGRRIAQGRAGWTGLKAHVTGFEPASDLEMHFSDSGYLGISRLPDGVNLCALVNERTKIAEFRRDPRGIFAALTSCFDAAARLEKAQIIPESICAVSGISFGNTDSGAECSLGDALQMIHPFTGNGMSLAVESAFLAAPVLERYCSHELTWSEALKQVKGRCKKTFRKRFSGASSLRYVTNRSWTRLMMLSSFRALPWLLPTCFRLTR